MTQHLRFILGAPILDKRFSTIHGYVQPERPGLPMLRLAFGYGPVTLPFGRQQTPPVMAIDGRLYLTERDAVGERGAVARLGGIGFARVGEMVRRFGLNIHWDDFLLDDGRDGAEWIDVMLHKVPIWWHRAGRSTSTPTSRSAWSLPITVLRPS